MDIVDRIWNSIDGMAVGNALSDNNLVKYHDGFPDIIGDGWTDNTEMVLAVAEGIIKDKDNPVPHIGKNFLRLRTKNLNVSNTVIMALNAYNIVKNWHLTAKKVHKWSDGQTTDNGALIRTLPLAFVYPDVSVLYRRCMEIAQMTHWDLLAGLTCFVYCDTIQEICHWIPFKQAYLKALDALRNIFPPGTEEDTISWLISKLKDAITLPKDSLHPSDHTVDTLACAIWAVGNSTSFEDAILKALKLGGDGGIVAVTGGLAGVLYCVPGNIPPRWRDAFFENERIKRLDSIAMKLIDLAKV